MWNEMNKSAVSTPILIQLDRFMKSPVSTILYLEGNRNYTKFWLKNGSCLLASKSLCVYESELPSHFV